MFLWWLPALFIGALGFHRRWICDDALIDLRVARNLIEGYGPVFNLSERVEAYSNPLWVGVLAIWGQIGGRLEDGAVYLGLVLTVCGVLAAQ